MPSYRLFRVAEIEHVGSTNDIPNPYHGQVVWLTGSKEFQYWSQTWQAFGTGSGGSGAVADILANRPAASPTNDGELFYATDVKRMYISDGATWTTLDTVDNATAIAYAIALS